MKSNEQIYCVDGVEVQLVRDESGAQWTCTQCRGQCEHILQVAAWVTLNSWVSEDRRKLH